MGPISYPLDLRGKIPSFLHISDGKPHDVNVPDITRSRADIAQNELRQWAKSRKSGRDNSEGQR